MPILQSDVDFDFTKLTAEEKKELIIKLLNKQNEIANFLIQNNPADYILRTYLTFITLICSSTFGDYFYNFIPNQVLSQDEFALLFASKLDNYLSDQAAQISENWFLAPKFKKKKMASQSTSTTPTAEVPPLTEKKRKIVDCWSPGGGRKKKLKESTLEEKMEIERKLLSGEYNSLYEMAVDMNGGTPSEEIEKIILKNMMRIMLK